MGNFILIDCGVCSSWNPYVKCKKSDTKLFLTITKCVNDQNNKYKIDSTILEEGCNVLDTQVELSKQDAEEFLNRNFELIGALMCVPFIEQRIICPTCNTSLEPGLC